MALATNITVSSSFAENTAIKPIAWKKLQTHSYKPNFSIFGFASLKMNPRIDYDNWEFFEGEKKGFIKVVLKKIEINLEGSSEIFVYDGLKKNTPCYKHVCAHENKHVKLYQASWESSRKELLAALKKADIPILKKPMEMEREKVSKFVGLSGTKILNIYETKMKKAIKQAKSKTNSIHTSQEEKKTGKLCNSCKPKGAR